ncbi:MAG: PHP domain-containing protein [Ruminococcaceae bacterium]|nr:PHP domain-containing protein [Oscillospiraceae bacterium]
MEQIKDLKANLKKEYPFKIELHAHTSPVSGCSDVKPRELVEIYKSHGYDAVVITNHLISWSFHHSPTESVDFYLKDYEEAVKYGEEIGIKVLLGVEYRFDENHNDYLIYGVDRDIVSLLFDCFSMGVEKFRKEIKLPNSVFIQAHPLREVCELCNTDILDGIETLNMHPNQKSQNARTVRIAAQNNVKIKIAGSDFHHKNCDHEALAALRTRYLPKDSFQLAKILKENDYILEIGEDSLVLP